MDPRRRLYRSARVRDDAGTDQWQAWSGAFGGCGRRLTYRTLARVQCVLRIAFSHLTYKIRTCGVLITLVANGRRT